jgi:hypothetical protein
MPVDPEVAERIDKALRFGAPDRPPVWEMIESPEVYERFAPGVPFPECAGIACERLGIDATYGCYAPAAERAQHDGDVVSARTVWRTRPVFRTIEDLRSFRPPRLDEQTVEEAVLARHEQARRTYEPHTMYLPQNGGWGFLPGYDPQTFEVISIALAEEPGALERYWDFRMQVGILTNTVTARHRLAPAVQCCEDVAYKTGLMVSPRTLRTHFFPRFRRVIAPLKQAGIKVIWHSDGNVLPVLPDALDIGIDGIDPLERTAGMDIAEVRQAYGRRLILVGNVDSRVLTFGSEQEVRRAVRECIVSADAGGGHFVQSDAGQIMPDVPVRNVEAYIDEVRRFRFEDRRREPGP